MLRLQKLGAVTFDYGNNIRTFAFSAASRTRMTFRALCRSTFALCSAKAGPFRWAALSGEASDIALTDELVLEHFPTTAFCAAG